MKLISPTTELRRQYLEMLEEWRSTGEELIPFPLRYDPTNFNEYVEMLHGFSEGKGIGTFVNHSTFWLVDDDNEIIGVSNIRHKLNESLLIEGGHIGFGIRPGKRKQGFATKILELSLTEAQKLGIEKVLVTCDKENTGSAKTIVKNGGVLWKEHILDGVEKQNYWIEIK